MFIALLRFGKNKAEAPKFMSDHNAWIKQGFDDGVFILIGSLQPNQGGSVIAHNISREDFETRVNEDPFVANEIVDVEILEIKPGKAVDRLGFLIPSGE
ncbi:YciI family protein [Curvivirga sp.]|uniref:YciI family protein n=1 Tax=Curvivirga sp. TaxID=2856848 RepID=UPI003B5B592F